MCPSWPSLRAALNTVAAVVLPALMSACAVAPAAAPAPAPSAAADKAPAAVPADALAAYPTSLRVEYVQECMNVNGGAFALLYQCSCVLDRMATKFTHEDFVEASTFAKYAALSGERGGEFRDPDRAQLLTRKFRSEQAEAYKACNVKPSPRPK